MSKKHNYFTVHKNKKSKKWKYSDISKQEKKKHYEIIVFFMQKIAETKIKLQELKSNPW